MVVFSLQVDLWINSVDWVINVVIDWFSVLIWDLVFVLLITLWVCFDVYGFVCCVMLSLGWCYDRVPVWCCFSLGVLFVCVLFWLDCLDYLFVWFDLAIVLVVFVELTLLFRLVVVGVVFALWCVSLNYCACALLFWVCFDVFGYVWLKYAVLVS